MPSVAAGNELTDRAIEETIRAASATFGALHVVMSDHPGLAVADPPTAARYRSIMERPDPTRDAQIAARANMARLARLGRVYDGVGI